MKRKPKRFHAAVIAAAALLTAAIAVSALIPVAGQTGTERQTPEADDSARGGSVLRLHIIANSDSDEDQRVKLLVRDAVLSYERERRTLIGANSAQQAETDLLSDGDGLYSAVKTVLNSENCGYDAQLMLGDFDFPDREYGGELYPAGNYRALRIILGDGGGHNWWCILFPPLCIINDPAPTACPQSAPVRFESLFVKLWKYIVGE